jgi:hypothetical protein
MLRLIITRVIITTPRPAGGTLQAFVTVQCLEIQSAKNFIALFLSFKKYNYISRTFLRSAISAQIFFTLNFRTPDHALHVQRLPPGEH